MQTKVTGGFWKTYQDLVRNEVIPYQWKALNDMIPDAAPSHAIKNFKIAAGLDEGEYYGTVFQDSDIGKWLEAVAYSLENHPDSHLESLADGVIDILEKAQLADGYLNTYYILKEGIENRWTNVRDNHELYCAGHLLEAAVAYYQVTGKDKFLKIMIKFVDHISSIFGTNEKQIHGYPGHQEIELALIKLFEVTDEERFLDLAVYFINQRGRKPHFYNTEAARRKDNTPYKYTLEYSQAHEPVQEQEVAVGHAVRAVYMYTAMADIARLKNDRKLLDACDKLWEDVTNKQMYVTGGIGSNAHMEAFSFDYDLPNDLMYNETCASIGLVFWAHRMSKLEHNSKFADVIERALYNGILSGMSLDGKAFLYVNPMEVKPDECCRRDKKHITPVRQAWFGTACCPPNISRLVSSIGKYAFVQDKKDVYVDLFMDMNATFIIENNNVSLSMKTNYPWNGNITIQVDTNDKEVDFDLHVRLPYWCENYEVKVNDQNKELSVKDGYLVLNNVTQKTKVDLELSIVAQKVYAKDSVRFDNYKVCLQRGPMIYCMEEIDNGKDLDALSIQINEPIQPLSTGELTDKSVFLEGKGLRLSTDVTDLYSFKEPTLQEVSYKAVPYFMWGNRKNGEMKVWFNANGLK